MCRFSVYKQDVIDMCTYKEVSSRDNSSSSSASPAMSSKHSHPSPTIKHIEHLDIRKPKEKTVLFRKFDKREQKDKDKRLSHENVNIEEEEHPDRSSMHHQLGKLKTISANCDTPYEHERTDTQSNGSSTDSQKIPGLQHETLYETECLNTNSTTEQNGESHTNGLPVNLSYKHDYIEDTDSSERSLHSSGMDRVTALKLSETEQTTSESDSTNCTASLNLCENVQTVTVSDDNMPNHKPAAQIPTRFNPFDNQQVSESPPSNASFLHTNYGMRPHRYSEDWRPVLILIPVRLGGLEFNPVYERCLQRVLQSQYSVGIIGGRPKHSLFFVGWQGEMLLSVNV